jgi:DNA-directed RNA polymerase specialized sigma24 family protein
VDVAAELGISVGSVYVAKSRVLQRLREELSGLLD